MKTKANNKVLFVAAFFLVSTLAACSPSNSGFQTSTAMPSTGSGTDTDNSQSIPDTGDTNSTTPPTPTSPAPDESTDSAKSLKIHAFSDMNIDTDGTYSSATISIVKSMISRDPAVILGVGDFIDGEKTSLSDSTYVSMWNSFSKKVMAPMRDARIPFMATPGNHDAYYNQERTQYSTFWKKNKGSVEFVDDANFPFYYSFIQEDVFFISLDDANYSNLKNRTTQLAWLKTQLTSARAKGARARVVYGHIPLYSIVASKANSSTVYQNGVLTSERRTAGSNTLEAILLNNNVDLVIFGHSHGFYSGHYTYPDGKKLQVVSMPCAGSAPRYLVGTSTKTPTGYVELTISETNKLTIRYYNSSGTLQSLSSLPASLTLDSKNGVRYVR
ncbi:metallophosphoesterase family protein [Bdellovibrio sp. HCB185ZH]|uniref:metallophosphoesterase family protein n=1 Tax=Bdellovibrio sp. HCB185ZH TaxID=3394235 RepID=UPI0039A58360